MRFFSDFSIGTYDVDGQAVVFRLTGGPAVRLDICSLGIIRCWAAPSGHFEKPESLSVEDESWPSVPFAVDDIGSYVSIKTTKLCIRAYKQGFRLEYFRPNSNVRITGESASNGMGWYPNGAVVLRHDSPADEHFFGLGSDNDARLGRLDRRGSVRDMNTGQTITSGCVTADFPVTFFLSTGSGGGGYGMFVDNTFRMEFDMAASDPGVYSWRADGGELLYYLFAGPSFREILSDFVSLTGKPPLPPLWTLGYIQSRCTYNTWEQLDDVIANFRQHDIPLDALVFDYDWPEHLNNFKWHSRWKGLSPEKLKAYRSTGLKFVMSNSGPMIRKDSSNYADALAKGVLASDGEGHTVVCGHYGGDLMDFTSPAIKDWLWPQIEPLVREGIEGWWLDLVEPEGDPSQTVYHAGPRARIHNSFALTCIRVYYEMMKEDDPDSRPFILSRTATAGAQRYGAAVWSGDVFSDYPTLEAHCPEALNACLSGLPYWTSDTGGFISGLYKGNSGDHGRLYERWMQFSVFTPILRSHKSGPCEPYAFGESVLEGCRKYIRLRYRLLPYIYSWTYETHLTGMPLMRSLVLDHQDDPAVYGIKDEYLFGRDLLVAPVLSENVAVRDVYFPEGTWIDWDYGFEYAGGQSWPVLAPQSRIPLFLRSGSIIPMLPEMNRTDEKDWDPLILRIHPDGESRTSIYRDDGQSMDYDARKAFTIIDVVCDDSEAGAIRVLIDESNKMFAPKRYELQIHCRSTPVSLEYSGKPIGLSPTRSECVSRDDSAWWDPVNRILNVRIAVGSGLSHVVTIASKGDVFVRPANPLVPSVGVGRSADAGRDQIPFFLPSPALPARILCSNFDGGGEAVAFHKNRPFEEVNAYRSEPVGLGICSDAGGGWEVRGIDANEWLEYSVRIPNAEYFDLGVRVLPGETDGFIYIEFDGKEVASLTVPARVQPGESWKTVWIRNVHLDRGDRVMKLYFARGGFRLNYLEFVALSSQESDAMAKK